MPNGDSPERRKGGRGAVHRAIGWCLELIVELLVRIAGKRLRHSDAPWLKCPLGDSVLIGTGIYERIAVEEKLELRHAPTAGLIPNFELLRGPSFDPDPVHPRVRHFYEHTAEYQMEAWSEVSLVGKFFLWLLVEFISKRMDQLNFPISPMEMARGMTSQIIQLVRPETGELLYTGWLRRLKSSGAVMFAGIYSIAKIPGESNPVVKVTFPDRGSANVYLVPINYPDGSFGLQSFGRTFGGSGFYRLAESGSEHWHVRLFKTLHEVFHVYEDSEKFLRTDHTISFLEMKIVRLHYKITPVIPETQR